MSGAGTERSARYAVGFGPALALLLYFPTLFGSFLSDDFLLNTFLTGDATPRIDWGAVFDDFVGPFAGLEGGGLYRPFVTLSMALNYAAGGTDPFGYHLVNVLLTAIASGATAWTCAEVATARRGLAAAVGGGLVALHPTLAETTGWIVARNSGLQLAFATVAMAGFAAWLRRGHRGGRGGRGPLGVALAGLVGGLLTKETAVLLPASFFALDVLCRGWRVPWRDRRVHLVTGAVVAGWFVLRRVVLGAFIGGDAGTAAIESAAPWHTLLAKLEMLLYPLGSGLPAPWSHLCGVLFAAALATCLLPALRDRAGRRAVLVGLAWVALHFAPTWRLAVDPDDLAGSRMVVGAVAVLAVLAGTLAARLTAPAARRAVGACLLLGLAPLAAARMAQYLAAYDDMRHLRGGLAEVAADASPARPVAVVAVNRNMHGIPFLNCNAVFPLLERPVAAQDTPMVSLGYVFQPVPGSEELLFDVGAWRALREMGSTLFEWHRAPGMPAPLTRVDRRAGRPPQPLPALSYAGGGRFVAPGPVDTFAVEALEVEVEGACPGGRVGWLFAGPAGTPTAFTSVPDVPAVFRAAPQYASLRGGTARGGNTVFYVDLSRSLTLLSLRLLGGLAGIEVEPEGGARPLRVRLLPRVDLLPLPRRVAGTPTPLADTSGQLFAPPLPAGAATLTLYLVGPDTTIPVPVRPGPVRLDAATQRTVRVILRSSRQDRYYFFFAADGARAWRSAVDWIVFRPRAAR